MFFNTISFFTFDTISINSFQVRPKDLVTEPRIFVDGTSRRDVVQVYICGWNLNKECGTGI